MPELIFVRLPPALRRAGVALRDETAGDQALARTLFIASRFDEIMRAGWPQAVMAVFLDNQFAAQTAHYTAHHPAADRWIVMRGDAPIGRLYVDRSGGDWRLLDIVLVPEARRGGIGAALINGLVRAARRGGAGVALSVARDNPRAEALYRRLGFVELPSDGATHRAMRHTPGKGQLNTAS